MLASVPVIYSWVICSDAEGQVIYLVGKADTRAEEDTADDEHGQVLSKGTQDGANAEGGATKNHDQFPATKAGHWSGEEAEESSCTQQIRNISGRARHLKSVYGTCSTALACTLVKVGHSNMAKTAMLNELTRRSSPLTCQKEDRGESSQLLAVV